MKTFLLNTWCFLRVLWPFIYFGLIAIAFQFFGLWAVIVMLGIPGIYFLKNPPWNNR